ncbi:lysozyme inhibitor LprI family protein [Pseudomonas siliginis]|uniref:lysozyme inhibitor LprI family protein n=1 Tax=Pseudomonas siliginis TaxID=2842346 RepID=UPI002B240FFC|nr:lysozyme inhibitor LprI family protein [Pseudomonas siliginis]MEB2653248.1 lysozyme inhibitor LprI family protein [Pseudomonas siliginis]
MYIKGRYILSACLLVFIQQATAAAMDCKKAANDVENMICANKSLYELDAQMGTLYRQLMTTATATQPELKRTQRAWLKTRNACADDVACLDGSYRQRLQILKAQWTQAVAWQPDTVDVQAMNDLQESIRAESKGHPEFALEHALAARAFESSQTSFAGDPVDSYGEQTSFPKSRPKGVSEDEWKALNASSIEGAAETGRSSYALLDLDHDGQRDLIVDTYAGGTGLFTYVETWRRTGERFVKRSVEPESSLFYTNDRGANQAISWIKLHDRIYAAYRNGAYGVDNLYLLNPLKVNRQVPTVSVRYSYALQVPTTQHKEDGTSTYELDADLQGALEHAITQVMKVASESTANAPLCPIPPTGAGDDDYYSYGPGHYTIEKIADLPVMIGGECYIGALIDWFGSYSEKTGLFAQLAVRKPGVEASGTTYEVHGRRHVTDVSSTLGKVELNGD